MIIILKILLIIIMIIIIIMNKKKIWIKKKKKKMKEWVDAADVIEYSQEDYWLLIGIFIKKIGNKKYIWILSFIGFNFYQY